jgi:glycosyltransferase involved in cell wall biosynthesis
MVAMEIGVVIPCYNAESYIAAAIDSVLSQTLPPSRIVVVDDGSTDSSAEVARRFGDRVSVISRPNGGISAARNTGIGVCDTALLAFLDADDLWVESKLERQAAELARSPELDCVFAHAKQFISPELSPEKRALVACREDAMPARLASAMMVRRDSFLKVGLFDERLDIGETIDWLARADEAGLKGRMLPEVLLERRLHVTNSGVVMRSSRPDYARVLKAALDRRRGKPSG